MKIVAVMMLSMIISTSVTAQSVDSKFLEAKKAARQSQWEQFHLLNLRGQVLRYDMLLPKLVLI